VKEGDNCRYNKFCCPNANGTPRTCVGEQVNAQAPITFWSCVDTTAQTATQTQVGSTVAQASEVAVGACYAKGDSCRRDSDCCPRGDGRARTCDRETVGSGFNRVTWSECKETTAPVIIGKNPVYTLAYPRYRCASKSFWMQFKQFSLEECKALCQRSEIMMYVARASSKNCACMKKSECSLEPNDVIDVYLNTELPGGECVKEGDNCRYNKFCCPNANGKPRTCVAEQVNGQAPTTFWRCVDSTAQSESDVGESEVGEGFVDYSHMANIVLFAGIAGIGGYLVGKMGHKKKYQMLPEQDSNIELLHYQSASAQQ